MFSRELSVPTIVAPTFVPDELPLIDLPAGVSPDSVVIGSVASRGGGSLTRGLDLTAAEAPRGDALRGADLLMRIVASGQPRYPESLRQSGIGGRVLVRFTVDTLGRIEMATVQILETTHDLFTRSVRDALQSFRFKPTEVGGQRVRSLAEMPFEFSISK